jgi:hypothetical protein
MKNRLRQQATLEHSLNTMIAEALWGKPKARRNTDSRKRVAKMIQAELVSQALPIVGDQELAQRVAYLACRVPAEMVKVFLGDADTIKRLAEKAATSAEPLQPPTLEELIPVAEEAMRIVRSMLAKR